MDLAALFSKLKIELWQLAGAGTFAGLTVLILDNYSRAPALTDMHGDVFMATVFAAWVFFFALVQPVQASISKKREARIYADRRRVEEGQLDQARVQLLTVLRPEQRHQLAAIKARGRHAFQAYDSGELDELCGLRLLQKSGQIGGGFALFVVPDLWVMHTDRPSHIIFGGMG